MIFSQQSRRLLKTFCALAAGLTFVACTSTPLDPVQVPTVSPIAAPMPATQLCDAVRSRQPVAPAYGEADFNAIAWMQTSVEYRANARTVYQAATQRLQTIFPQRGAVKPPFAATEQTSAAVGESYAVILDVDETILDNSANQARMFRDRNDWNLDAWNCWLSLEQATLIPGAHEFFAAIHQLQERGIDVQAKFITNRECVVRGAERCPQRRETLNNLNRLLTASGYRARDEDLLLKNDIDERGQVRWPDNEKHDRRVAVARDRQIILLLGDDIGDFYPDVRKQSLSMRCSMTATVQSRWGDTWFMLPNAMYGSWLDVLKATVPPERRGSVLEAFDYPGLAASTKRDACWPASTGGK